MKVTVYGTWHFNGGGAKIAMPCGSSVVLGFGGQVTGNGTGNSQTIQLCNTTYWSANQGTIPGPSAWPEWAMPVELIAFNAYSKGVQVDLAWSTASEQNSAAFELARSRDGQNWVKVSTQAAAGYSNSIQEYRIQDQVPIGGLWYYALEQIDTDGTVHDKGVISVEVKEERKDLLCGPIPAVDGWVDAFWPGGEIEMIQLVDMQGNKFSPKVLSIAEGAMRLDLSMAQTGQHIICAYGVSGERRTCRVIVQ